MKKHKKGKKNCRYCKEEKPYSFFLKSKSCIGGYNHMCLDCRTSGVKHVGGMHLGLRIGLDSSSSEYRKKASLKFRINNFELNMLLSAKSSAKKRGLEFNLEISDIIIPIYCPYLGFKLTRAVGQGKVITNPSIDRVDNKKGYTKGNIHIISDLANSMKREATIEQLIMFSKNAIKIHSK